MIAGLTYSKFSIFSHRKLNTEIPAPYLAMALCWLNLDFGTIKFSPIFLVVGLDQIKTTVDEPKQVGRTLETTKKIYPLMPRVQKTRVIVPGEKALMVDRFNIKIIYVPYTNKPKSQIG